jgi:beta-glucosidase
MENDYNDAAIMVITREGSEGCDVKTINATDTTKTDPGSKILSHKHALQLSDNEQDLFDYITDKFENVIIVINSGNIYQCDQFENNDAVKAVLWAGTVGDVGAGAIGRILAGEVNPSGHTVDTWARDFTKDPTYQNFSDNAQTNVVKNAQGEEYYYAQDTMFNADGSPVKSEGSYKGNPKWENEEQKVVDVGLNGVRPSAYVSYEEGIYYDYRYYETRYAEVKAAGGDADAWYESEEGVIYPFGYGLSYTEFEQKIVSSNIDHKILKSGNMKVQVEVEVKNTGSVAGKEVVQLYWRAPYIAGGIEKADKVLCAFDKTDMLEPGDSQKLTLEFNTQEVANYDCFDKNNNGFCGYELDGGDYQIVLGKNAHEELDEVNFKVAEGGIKYEVDLYTGATVENRFTDRGFYSSLPSEDDFEFTQFSREDMEETFPTHPTIEDRTLGSNSRIQEFFTHAFTPEDIDSDVTNYEYMPKEAYKSKEDIEALGWTQPNSAPSSRMQFSELYNVDYDDPKWDEFMNQMTYAELLNFTTGGDQNPAISGTGKPGITSQDGPQKFKGAQGVYWVCLPIAAATYNVELVTEQGKCIGNETIYTSNTYGWCGPAVNLHRSPFGGRNFEYYSADPLISGRMGGRVVAGATDGGIYCFFKHFAVNDQEKHREGVAAFLSEQALREIYLKAFQIVVQEGKSTGIMSSYNRIGLMESAASYPLLTEVLRNEWGFKGQVFSDMTHHSNSAFDRKYYENINNRILAGDSQQLDGSSYKNDVLCEWNPNLGCPTYNGTPSYSWWYAVRKAAHDTMYSAAKCAAIDKSKVTNAHITIEGQKDLRYTKAVDEEVNIKLNVPEQYASYELAIDPFTPLPEGLSLNDNVISGSSDVPVNKFIHVMVMAGTQAIAGTSIELLITAVGDNAETEDYVDPKPDGKKGCFGGFEISMIAMSAISVLALGVLLINKKRKIAE